MEAKEHDELREIRTRWFGDEGIEPSWTPRMAAW